MAREGQPWSESYCHGFRVRTEKGKVTIYDGTTSRIVHQGGSMSQPEINRFCKKAARGNVTRLHD